MIQEASWPLLSIVVVGRNDDFGGDFNARMMAAAEFNHRHLTEAGVSHEYLFVEWNPIPGKEYLADLIVRRFPWWHRCFVVDAAWHQKLSVNPKLAFMEFFAKNVGIRRARGRFVLTTNTDIWLSRGVLRVLPRLSKGILYRSVRIDLKREVGCDAMTFDVLDDPETALRVNVLNHEYFANAAGDFLLLDRETYMDLRGFNEIFRESKIHKDANFCIHARHHGLPIEVLGAVYHFDHESSWNNVKHLYGPNHIEAPFGRSDWDWRADYENPVTWGLADAPEQVLESGLVYISCR